VQGLGFGAEGVGVQGLDFRVWRIGYRVVEGLGLRVWRASRFRAQGLEFGISDLGFGVQGRLGFRVLVAGLGV
jgi:hypothetical protein